MIALFVEASTKAKCCCDAFAADTNLVTPVQKRERERERDGHDIAICGIVNCNAKTKMSSFLRYP